MATYDYETTSPEEEKKKKQSFKITDSSSGVTTGSVSDGQKEQKGTGTGWVNLTTYLDRQGDAGERLGQQVQDHIENKNELDDKRDLYQKSLDSIQKTGSEAFTDYSDKDGFAQAWNAEYKGPTDYTSVDNYDEAVNAKESLNQSKNALKDYTGWSSLLDESFGGREKDTRTRGGSALDSAILASGGRSKLKESDNYIDNEFGSWTNLQEQAKSKIEDSKKSFKDLQNNTRNTFNTNWKSLIDTFDDKQSQLGTIQERLNSERNDKISKHDWSQYGGESGKNKLINAGFDISKLYTQGKAGLGDLVSDEQAAKYQAMASLADITGNQGRDYDFSKSTSAKLNDSLASQAKTYGSLLAELEKKRAIEEYSRRAANESFWNRLSDDDIARTMGIDRDRFDRDLARKFAQKDHAYVTLGDIARQNQSDIDSLTQAAAALNITAPDLSTHGTRGGWSIGLENKPAYYAALQALSAQNKQNESQEPTSTGGYVPTQGTNTGQLGTTIRDNITGKRPTEITVNTVKEGGENVAKEFKKKIEDPKTYF